MKITPKLKIAIGLVLVLIGVYGARLVFEGSYEMSRLGETKLGDKIDHGQDKASSK